MSEEVYLALRCAEKALQKVIDENPKAGLIIDKGTRTEARMRYKKALRAIEKLQTYFGHSGALTIGTCGTCNRWNIKGNYSLYVELGNCELKRDITHQYESCNQHGG